MFLLDYTGVLTEHNKIIWKSKCSYLPPFQAGHCQRNYREKNLFFILDFQAPGHKCSTLFLPELKVYPLNQFNLIQTKLVIRADLAEKGNLGSGPLELEIKMKQTAEKAYVSHRYSANIKHPASIF